MVLPGDQRRAETARSEFLSRSCTNQRLGRIKRQSRKISNDFAGREKEREREREKEREEQSIARRIILIKGATNRRENCTAKPPQNFIA